MPFLVKDFMRANVDVLGLLYAAFPLGYVIGAMWFGRREKIRQRGPSMYLCLALAAISLAFFGIHLPLWALVAAALVNGVALELQHLAWLNLLQEKIPNEQLGRVFSIDAIGSFALLPVGLALVGWGVETFGPQTMFLVGGGLTALIALAVLALSPTIRRLD
jgi:MFS family permease